MTFLALKNHSKRTYRFRKGDFFSGSRYALAMIMLCLITYHRSELDIDGSRKRKNFFRLALRARHDYVPPNHTFEENLTVQEKGFFFPFALRAHHDNFVSNQHSERTSSLTIKKDFFSGLRYALALIIFCLYYTL